MSKLAIPFLAIGLIGVSFGAPLARFVPELPALTIAFWRMVGASILLWTMSAIKQQGTIRRDKLIPVSIAGFFLALHFICFYGALKLIPVANATLFSAMFPIFTLAYERFAQNRRIGKRALVGLWLALAGVLLIQGFGLNLGRDFLLGNILALASSLFVTVVILLAEKARSDLSNILFTRWLYLFAAITLGAVGVVSSVDLSFHTNDLVWLITLAVVPTLIGHNSMNYAVKFLRPSLVASMPLGEPVFASILAWLLFRESVQMETLLGGIIVLTGLIIVAKNRE